jgi:hypothetical protein
VFDCASVISLNDFQVGLVKLHISFQFSYTAINSDINRQPVVDQA